MKNNQRSKGENSVNNPETTKLVLQFVCPKCSCRNLRTMLTAPHYPAATLECVTVDATTLESAEIHEREDIFEWVPEDPLDGYEFWCNDCGLVPDLEKYESLENEVDQLARWLLDNCPQTEHEDAKLRTPTFTCPKCGGQRLDLVHDSVTLREEVQSVSEDNSIVWGGSSYEGNDDTEEYFQCRRCDLILRDEDGEEVDEKSLGQWLRANCVQEKGQGNGIA